MIKECKMFAGALEILTSICMSETILRFEMNLYNFNFFFTGKFIFVFSSKYQSS
jgi:hypothetical protein